MKSQIKKALRSVLPSELFARLYRVYAKASGMQIDASKIKKYSNFTKKDFYDFDLSGTHFKIMLDPDNGGVDAEIYADGCYEADMLRLIKSNLTDDDVFLDIGANIGQHSLYASRHCSHVYSFEPIRRLCEQLDSSIFINDFLNINTYNYALGNDNVSLPIYGSVSNMGASSLVTSENRVKIQNIKVLRLDDVYQSIGLTRCDMVKIDVEGYELDVLLGAAKLIAKYKPKILIEYSPIFYKKVDKNNDTSTGQKIYQFLISNNYKIIDVVDGRGVVEVTSFEQLRDVEQTNLFCISRD